MNNICVSVIIPCYNVEKYLNRCINSVVNQSLKNIEVILVDDKSLDGTSLICDEWEKKDNRIKVVHKDNNEGLGFACNTGINLANGEYIAFCDSDDWIDSEMYETMFNEAIANNAQMVLTGLKRVDLYGNFCGFLPHRKQKEIYHGKAEIDSLACDMIASAPNIRQERTIQMSAKVTLYHRDTIVNNRLRFFSEREIMSEDLHFNLHYMSHCNCVCVLPYYFYNYMINTTSITGTIKFDKFFQEKKLYKFVLKECNELGMSGNYLMRSQRMFLGYVRSYISYILISSIPSNKKKEIVKHILEDSIWDEFWGSYPFREMPLAHLLFTYGIKYKSFAFLYLLSNLKR